MEILLTYATRAWLCTSLLKCRSLSDRDNSGSESYFHFRLLSLKTEAFEMLFLKQHQITNKGEETLI